MCAIYVLKLQVLDIVSEIYSCPNVSVKGYQPCLYIL